MADTVQDALGTFAESLTANFASNIAGDPEDQLKAPIVELLASVGRALGMDVVARTESRVPGLGGRPDVGVGVGSGPASFLAGHIELKAPGKGAKTERFKTTDAAQWKKFTALPNLIYTDGNEWALYRSGKREGVPIKLDGDATSDGAHAVGVDDSAAIGNMLSDFLHWEPVAPTNPKALAEALAPLCRLLRDDVASAVGKKDSALELLNKEWRTYLFPHADNKEFADAYAQTLTYALLLARLEGAEDLRLAAADALDANHGLLAQVLRVLSQPAARREIHVGIDLLERVVSKIDPSIMNNGDNLWLYFYEDFLAAYDEKLRKQRGVYYTPSEVVSFQVRLVGELLETRFKKNLTFADDEVFLLDPAAGTGAYPLAAAQHGLARVSEIYGEGAAASRATTIGQNVHAFELLVGPYAVTHLRLAQQILKRGGTLPAQGVNVFLADTLESPIVAPSGQQSFDLMHKRLSEESARARAIKADQRVLVCIGNPPYYRQLQATEEDGSEQQGGWVRFGDHGDDGILGDFISPVVEHGNYRDVKNLYNLYVYFWRWALWKVFEASHGAGIVSFITASSYLRGPGFIGMRKMMREVFDELWIVDLEGHARSPRKTENVFEIANPVAIAIGLRNGTPNPTRPAHTRYIRVTGTRAEKLAYLESIESLQNGDWQDCYSGWFEPFLPKGSSKYYEWPLVTDLFPWQYSGVQFKRSWPIGESRSVLEMRWAKLLESKPADRATALRETSARRADGSYRDILDPSKRLQPITSLKQGDKPAAIRRYGFRSFDRQWVIVDNRLCDRARAPLWHSHSDKQLYMTSLLTDILGLGPAATIASDVPDLHYFCNYNGGRHIVPLWRDRAATSANVTPGLLAYLSDAVGRAISALDLFAYAYAILASPTYVETFNDELAEPGPRLPITTSRELFDSTVSLGNELVWLHSFGERFVDRVSSDKKIAGAAKCTRAVPGSSENYPETFSYDPSKKLLKVGDGEFGPVSHDAWNFTVSGFEVLQSWLKYRMADRYGRSSSTLDTVRPSSWPAEMTEELLKVIWVIEGTVNLGAALRANFDSILASELVVGQHLPYPAEDDRKEPEVRQESAEQMGFDI